MSNTRSLFRARLALLAAALPIACQQDATLTVPIDGPLAAYRAALDQRFGPLALAGSASGQLYRRGRWLESTALVAARTAPLVSADATASAGAAARALALPQRRLGVRLAHRFSGGIDAMAGASARHGVRVTPLDARPAQGHVDGSEVLYREAWRSTDVLYQVDGQRLKELLVLKDQRAPRRFRFRLALGAGLRDGGRDEHGWRLTDASGRVRLRIARPWAIDADGRRHDLRWTRRGELLELALPADLSLPAVVDPTIGSPKWADITPIATKPQPRSSQGMAYDSCRKRVVLFGGGSTAPRNDTWEWDGDNGIWRAIAIDGPSPGPRWDPALAFDADRCRVLLFGGTGTFGPSTETWEYDGAARRWTQITPAGAVPPGRARAAMVYDGARKRMVLFGGQGASSALADLWELDPASASWSAVTPAGNAPPARFNHAMAYDSDRGRTIVVGGDGASGTLDDTWEWSGTGWSETTPTSPAPNPQLASWALAYDGTRQRALLGGTTAGGSWSTWEYDGTAGSWASVSTGASLGNRHSHRVAFDGARGKVILFGGRDASNGNTNQQTWEFDAGAGNWLDITPPAPVHPPARHRHALAYDSDRDRVLLFGGEAGSTALQDTWEWDGVTELWSAINPASKPVARKGHALAYDAANKVVVLVGGAEQGGTVRDDIWTYDGSNWTDVTPATPRPSARADHALAYHGGHARVVLFGGHDGSTALSDAWEWNGATKTWTDVTPGGSTPAARSRCGLAYDGARGLLLLFGGEDAAGTALADLWSWDGTSTSWTDATAAGPVARTAATLCFDANRTRLLLFGGFDASGAGLDDTWELDPASGWTAIDKGVAGAPGARGAHAAAIDNTRNRLFVFGGRSGAGSDMQDVWSYRVTNIGPTLLQIGNRTVSEGATLSLTLGADDPDQDVLGFSATGLPAGATLDGQSGAFSWTPGFDQAGSYPVTFTVTDGALSDSETITITVQNTNRAPVFDAVADQLIAENETLTLPLAAIDPDGDAVTYGSGNLPGGATLDPQTGVFSWTPTFDAAAVYNVTFTASDGSQVGTITVQVTVTEANRAPQLKTIDDKDIREDQRLSFIVRATDPDGDVIDLDAEALPIGAKLEPLQATASGEGTWLFSWTPTFAQAGTYEVTFTVTDQRPNATPKRDAETISISVLDANRPPSLSIDKTLFEIPTGEALSLVVVTSDPDPDDTLTLGASDLPAGATFDADSGTFDWTPGADQTGTFEIGFEVKDAAGLSARGKIFVIVYRGGLLESDGCRLGPASGGARDASLLHVGLLLLALVRLGRRRR